MSAAADKPDALRRLRKRSQFQRAARGDRTGRSAFGLQAIKADAPDPGVGFTVTKKTGNSPERNRIKRRLRAAVTACARDFRAGHDYVLVGRREALTENFDKLVADLRGSLKRVHNPRPAGENNGGGRAPRKPRP